jgi:hypothetical protein
MIVMLQSMLPEQSATNNTAESIAVENDFIKSKKVKATKAPRPNKFSDMPEKNMHKEDIAIDKKLAVHPPVPRARQFASVDVQCRVCGRKETVNPVLLPDSVERYKCNKCSSSAG